MRDKSMEQKHMTYWKEEWKKFSVRGWQSSLSLRYQESKSDRWKSCAMKHRKQRAAVVVTMFKTRRRKAMSYHNKKVTYIYIFMHYHCCYISFLCVSAFRARKYLLFLSVCFAIRIDLFLNTLSQLTTACFHHRLHN